jgi:hypothetical protein
MKTLVLLALLVASPAHASLTGADLKACAFNETRDFRYFRSETPKFKDFVYVFKGTEVYRVKLPATTPFSISQISKEACFDRSGLAAGVQDCKTPARDVIKLDGVSMNEPFTAVMEEYTKSAQELTDAGSNPDAIQKQSGDLKHLASRMERCAELGPLTKDARAALTNAQDAVTVAYTVYGLSETPSSIAKAKRVSTAK